MRFPTGTPPAAPPPGSPVPRGKGLPHRREGRRGRSTGPGRSGRGAGARVVSLARRCEEPRGVQRLSRVTGHLSGVRRHENQVAQLQEASLSPGRGLSVALPQLLGIVKPLPFFFFFLKGGGGSLNRGTFSLSFGSRGTEGNSTNKCSGNM